MKHFKSLRLKYKTAEVLVTGHSLGGAIATFAALEIRHSGYNVDHFYTFGCPRVGSSRFAKYFNK